MTYDDIQDTATRASCFAKGLMLLLEEGSKEATDAAYVVGEELKALTAQLTSDLDSVNRPTSVE